MLKKLAVSLLFVPLVGVTGALASVQADPQPGSNDPVWEGHYPEGAIYAPYCLPRINMGQNGCFVVGGTNEECLEWRATPPWEVPDPGELARQALQRMRLSGPDIGMAPPPGSNGVIGVPVWLWNNVNDGLDGDLAGQQRAQRRARPVRPQLRGGARHRRAGVGDQEVIQVSGPS